jgi:hypothetical protein
METRGKPRQTEQEKDITQHNATQRNAMQCNATHNSTLTYLYYIL